MSMFADYNDYSRANFFLKCFNKVFEFDEGRRTASMLNVMDYNDFLELLQEEGAIHKTNGGRYWIDRRRL